MKLCSPTKYSIYYSCVLLAYIVKFSIAQEVDIFSLEPTIPLRSPEEIDRNETFLSDDDFVRPLNAEETFLTEEDFKNAEALSDGHIGAGKILWRQFFRKGDIRGKAAWKLEQREGWRRNGVINGVRKWPNGRIPYVLSNQYNERERAVLARSFQAYHSKTCIKFVPRTALDNDYLYIGKIDGCFSDVGRAGGRQELSLDDGCMQYDTAIHELMHSVGFYHEHERWDRDQHINILWHNIDKDAYDQFGKVDLAESSYYGQVYDYYSIMHYDSLAFSKNGFETMVAKRPEMTAVIGAAIDFSPVDVLKMNLMYQCTEAGEATPIVTEIPKPVAVQIVAPEPDDECRDRTNLCWRWLDRCRSFFFEKIMQEFCPLSCGFCTPKPKSAAPSSQTMLETKVTSTGGANYLQFGR
ncbi:unnamed protein product [Caenorhabditis auriculariae]|uniref:Metalloendopeptidase n=1 Tax=Caenorhabditis auriculariae TaxID=2777116 RepID=A0A8S1HP64_9PELO|nr:unnamed protein product [Caenorhabditis auriculariae]